MSAMSHEINATTNTINQSQLLHQQAVHQLFSHQKRVHKIVFGILVTLLLGTFLYSKPVRAEGFVGHSQPFIYTDNPSNVPAPPFRDEDGNLQRLSDYKGQVVLVNLWATWCSACLYEMPELNTLQKEWGNQGLKVLTLNQDLNDGKTARQFLQAKGYSHLTGHLDQNYLFGQAFGQKLLPMTLLFDTNGHQVGHLVGAAEWNSTEAKNLIGRYLPRNNQSRTSTTQQSHTSTNR